MSINTFNTWSSKNKEVKITDKFNYRIFSSLCNKHNIKIWEKTFNFSIDENDLQNSSFINYDDWWLDFDIDWIKYKWLYYIISEVNWENKYSKDFYNCTSVIAIWKDKISWENISFLTHQHPDSIKWKMFKEDLNKSLNELKEKSIDWSIDIVILWWNNNNNFNEYVWVIEELKVLINEKIWINPDVIWWPTNNYKESFIWYLGTSKDILLNTKKRQIKFYKSFLDKKTTIDYNSSKVTELF